MSDASMRSLLPPPPPRRAAVRLDTLLLALLLAALLPALVVGGWATRRALDAGEAAARSRLADTASALALAVDREIGALKGAAQALAASRSLDGPTPDLQGFETEARRVTRLLEASIVLLDGATLRQRVNTALPPGTPVGEVSAADFGAVVATGRAAVTNLVQGAVTRRPVVGVAVPVERGGRVTHVVSVRLEPERLRALLSAQPLSPGAIASVTDGKDVIVARSDALHARFLGQRAHDEVVAGVAGRTDGMIRATTLEGVPKVIAFRTVSAASQWRVFVSEPVSAFEAAWAAPMRTLASWGVLLLLGGAGLALLVARAVLGPVRQLTEEAAALADGRGPGTGAARAPSLRVRELERLREGYAVARRTIDARSRALADSEDRLRSVLAASALGTWRWDLVAGDGRLEWDAHCKAMFGLPADAEVDYARWSSFLDAEDRERVEAAMARALDPADPDDELACDYRVHAADGAERWLSVAGRAEFERHDPAPGARRAVRLLGTIGDVTARREAARALAELNATLDLATVFVRDLDGTIRHWPQGCESLYGWTAAQAIGRSAHELLRTVLPVPVAEIDAALERDGEWSGDARHVTRDGEERIVALRMALRRGASGTAPAVVEAVTDLTDAREAQARLEASEARYRTLFEHMAEEVHLWEIERDAAGRILTWRLVDANPPALRTWGRPLDEISGRTPDEIFGPGSTEHYRAIVERIDRERAPVAYEDHFPHLDRHFRFTSVPIGERFLTTGADVTVQKRAEDQLRESADRLQLALEAGRMGVFAWDVDVDRLEWDDRQHELFGTDPDAPPPSGERALASVHPDDRPALKVAIEAALSRENGTFRSEFRVLRPDGPPRWIAGHGRAVTGPAGRRLVGLNFDITERREAEAALARVNRELRTAAERVQLALAAGAIVGTWDWDLPTDRFTVDERFAEHFGIDPALGREGLALEQVIATVHPDDLPGLRAAIAEAIGRSGAYRHEYRVRGLDGVYRWIEANGRVDHAADGTPSRFPGVLLDIGRRRAMEAERAAAERGLRESEALLSAVLDALPVGVLIADAQGRLLRDNAADRAIWGVPPEAGRPERYDAFEGYWPGTGRRIRPHEWAMSRALLGGETVRGELVEAQPYDGGPRRFYLNNAAPVRDAAGRIVAGVVAELDVTDARRADAERERLRAAERRALDELRQAQTRLDIALRAARMGVWEWTPATGEARWNDQMFELLGLPACTDGTERGDSFIDRVHVDDRPTLDAALARALVDGGDFEAEVRVVGGDGGVRWLLGRGRLLRDAQGGADRMVGVNLDISERKVAEQALHEADRRRNEFLAMLGHELRNPLAPITNAVRLLERAGERPDRARTAVDIIRRQSAHMARLVDDLLEASRVTQGRIELRKQDILMASAVLSAVESVRPMVRERGQSLEVDVAQDVEMVVDPARLTQVVANLLNNASKYTHPGGRLAVRAGPSGPGWVEIVVSDDGPGIAPDLLPRVFDLFAQGDTTIDRAHGGLGLGLALVKRLVELHGGTVQAASAGVGRGAAFTVRLPRTERRHSDRASTIGVRASEHATAKSGDAAGRPRADGG